MIEYDKYKKALKNLELQFANYRALDPALSGLMREAVEELPESFQKNIEAFHTVLN